MYWYRDKCVTYTFRLSTTAIIKAIMLELNLIINITCCARLKI